MGEGRFGLAARRDRKVVGIGDPLGLISVQDLRPNQYAAILEILEKQRVGGKTFKVIDHDIEGVVHRPRLGIGGQEAFDGRGST